MTRLSFVLVAVSGIIFGLGSDVLAQSTTRRGIRGGGQPSYQQRHVYESGSVPSSGGSTTRARSTAGSATRAQPSFEDKFWSYLNRAKYRNWAPVPGKSDAMYTGQSPHGAFLKMYLNRIAAGQPGKLRNGSIIVKENYGADQKTLMAITVMYRSPGYSSAGGDWYWAKFLPDGTVDRKEMPTGPMRLAGRVKGCIECHGDAEGGDFAFFND